ncbi:MAG: aldo/keto reductase, partial [Bacteroidetes bacterium]|nr:aldo/keto reductase [Bacteroidota bacterium]
QELGLGLIPWSPLGGGLLTGKYSRKDLELESTRDDNRRGINKKLLTEKNFQIIDELALIAKETGYSQAQVAINWVLRRPGVCSPIIGARTMKQLESNLASLDFSLSDDQMERLNNLSAVEPIFPYSFLGSDIMDARVTSGTVVEKRG